MSYHERKRTESHCRAVVRLPCFHWSERAQPADRDTSLNAMWQTISVEFGPDRLDRRTYEKSGGYDF